MNLIDIDDNTYSSVIELFEISLVAVCELNKQKVEAYNRDPKHFPRVGFLFPKTKELEKIIKNYVEGEILVEPKAFSEKVRELKSRTKIPY